VIIVPAVRIPERLLFQLSKYLLAVSDKFPYVLWGFVILFMVVVTAMLKENSRFLENIIAITQRTAERLASVMEVMSFYRVDAEGFCSLFPHEVAVVLE
jgi:hypothetical protein